MSNNSSQSLEKIKKSKFLRFLFYDMLNKVELINEQEKAKNKKSKPILLRTLTVTEINYTARFLHF